MDKTEMDKHEMFKSSLRGFDKDEVISYIELMEDEQTSEIEGYKKEVKDLTAQVEALKERINLKEKQKEDLEKEIEEKYKKYIDNYDNISKLVFDAQVKADNIVKDAEAKAEKMINDADIEAKERVESVQDEVNEKLADGKKKYIAVQLEMNEIVDLINEAQKRFLNSYKEVHNIISTMPDSLRDIDEEE